ncbi:M6 family metalloprotease domain-containing protein [Brevibacillus dissolubilis]|uniref:M6 family metalloprotease domain-containing protein n=1 Tax=Brevibacillus dissolubilis TaxID=1844116 RepID=UPI001117629B|nr:M6 family metalloprotease domain-containing protein [Brevibacillus dissolubilis]
MRWKKSAALSLATVFSALSIAGVSEAMPALPQSVKVTQPSGESFQVSQHGDEWFNWAATEEGDVIIKDHKGYWNYAILDKDDIKSSGAKYKIDKKCKKCVSDKEMREWVKKNKPHEKKKKKLGKDAGKITAQGIQSNDRVNVNMDVTSQIEQEAVRPDALTGTKKLLILLVDFNDTTIRNTEATWSNRFFGTATGTVRHYFNEVSNGRLTLAPAMEASGTGNDGVVRVKLGYNHPNTGRNTGTANQQIVTNALAAADPYVNFASFDTDGDGDVERDELYIVTVTAGYEASYNSNQTPNIWAHHWYTSWSMRDGKNVTGEYVQQGEIQGDHMATMGVLCHELAHSFGLPDLYDTDGSSLGAGIHSLMASGSWGYVGSNYQGSSPTQPDAWSKVYLGFVDPYVVSSQGNWSNLTLNATPGSSNVIKIPSGISSNEYFLLENRQFNSYDGGLRNVVSGSGGIAVWHVDDSLTSNANDSRRWVDLEESNEGLLGYSQLDTKRYNGYDHYFYSSHVNQFSPVTRPSSNTYEGTNTGIRVTVNSTSGTSMGIGLTVDRTAPTAPGNLQSTARTASTITLNWTASTDSHSGLATYKLYRNGVYLTDIAPSLTSYTDGGLATSTSYSYYLSAVDQMGNQSAASDTISVLTQASGVDVVAPAAPTNVVATAVASDQVDLSWSAATDDKGVVSYHVYRSGAEVYSSPNLFFEDHTVTGGRTYDYTVRARDAAGNMSPVSNTATVTTPAPPAGTSFDFPLSVSAGISESYTLGAGQETYFRYVPAISGMHQFTTVSSLDTYGHLYNDSRGELAADDDSGDGNNTLVSYSLTAGQTYYFKVRGYNAAMTGSYQLNIIAPTGSAGDSFSNPIPVSAGTTESYTLQAGQALYYRYVPTASGTYTITTLGTTDTYGHLYNSAQTELVTNDDDGEGNNTQITYNLTAGQTYYIKIRGYNTSTTGAFQLKISQNLTFNHVEGDSFANSIPIQASAGTTYQLHAGQSYYFLLVPGQTRTYSLSTQSDVDLYGHLYDASQMELAANDDDGDGNNPLITYTLDAYQTYYFQVRGYHTSTNGSFQLVLN